MLFSHHEDNWRLLTLKNIRTRKLWGWGHSIQKHVISGEPRPRDSSDLLIASDFSGDHPKSTHNIYCYLIVRSQAADWVLSLRDIRQSMLTHSRRMSYKRLDDPQRQMALIPFLRAAADIDGHLVAIAVDKQKRWLSTYPGTADKLRETFGLKASWNPRSLEAMMRKVHFAAVLLPIWARPYTNLTWITDEDEFVANDARHDDALQVAARMSSLYISHSLGVLRLNTVDQETDSSDFEDFCSIPDLAAGALAEISTRLREGGTWADKTRRVLDEPLRDKTDLIADWFWDGEMRLRKTMITIDLSGNQFGVRKVWMSYK